MLAGKVAGNKHAHFVGENLDAFIVHHAATVAIAVKGKADIGFMRQHRVA